MMTYKQQKGFTLIEMMIVIAIIAILAALAAPSMIDMKRKYELQRETNSFVAKLNEARSEAVLKRTSVSVSLVASQNTSANASQNTSANTSQNTSTNTSQNASTNASQVWQSTSPNIVLETTRSDAISFDYMGRSNVANDPECLVLKHNLDADVKAVVFLYKQGGVQHRKNVTECPR